MTTRRGALSVSQRYYLKLLLSIPRDQWPPDLRDVVEYRGYSMRFGSEAELLAWTEPIVAEWLHGNPTIALRRLGLFHPGLRRLHCRIAVGGGAGLVLALVALCVSSQGGWLAVVLPLGCLVGWLMWGLFVPHSRPVKKRVGRRRWRVMGLPGRLKSRRR